MAKGKKLFEYLGKNEKTKVVVKITKAGTGAPSREPLMNSETHMKVMSDRTKKEEEEKKMKEEKEETYTNSSWANPIDLKKQVHGITEIKWK